MDPNRFPLPSEQRNPAPYEDPQYTPPPGEVADFYAQTPGEPAQELPQPLEPSGNGQFTGPTPERAPDYAMPAHIAAFHQGHTERYPQQQQVYSEAAPQHQEQIPSRLVDPARIGFRGLVGRMRDRIARR